MSRRPATTGLARSLWRFRRYGRPHIPALVGGIGLRLAELVADLAKPWPLAIVVDGVIGRHRLHGLLAAASRPFSGSPTELLTVAAAAALLLAVLSGAFDYLGDRIMNSAGERITTRIRRDLFSHLQRLPLAYHDRQSVGELTSRVVVDTDRIEDSLVDIFSTLVPGLVTLGGLTLVVFLLDWRLGLLTGAVAPVVLPCARRLSELNRQAAVQRRLAEAGLSALVTESLTGIRTIHAHGRHAWHDERFDGANAADLQAGLRSVDLRARFTPVIEVSAAAGTSALLWLGGYGVIHGWWTLGLLLVVTSYLRDMLKPVRALSRLSQSLARGAVSAQRVADILDVPGRPSVPASPRHLPERVRGHLELSGVTLDYGRGAVLSDVDLEVGAGQRVALVGANGSGKSSLLAVLAGLYQPTAGEVRLDGRPLGTLPDEWLCAQLGVVLQETFLFAGTLWDNIAYGRPGASPEEILDAADAALVDDFAETLPDSYSTILGERGVGLSGGQRQRVGIARAILLGGPIVLLDEPTSSLDLEAESVVIEALARLMAGRTVVMATHRPALLRLAQRVVTVERGHVIECAPEDPLHGGRPALYPRLVRRA